MNIRLTLKLRITVFVGLLLILVISVFTAFSIRGSNKYFGVPQMNKIILLSKENITTPPINSNPNLQNMGLA